MSPSSLGSCIAVVVLTILTSVAAAQPGASPPSVPAPAPAPTPIPATPPGPGEVVPAGPALDPAAAPTPVDPPELRAAYDRAFALLLTEQWDQAAAAFAAVASQSVEAERRGAAAELARLAREYDSRSVDGPKKQSGRAGFVSTSTLASIWVGFVFDDLLGIEDGKTSTLLITGTTLGGFAAALYGTRGRTITSSMASAYGSGITVGLANGLLLAPVLGIEIDGGCRIDSQGFETCDDGEVNQNYLGFGLATMALGGAAGTYLAHLYDPTPAQARFAGVMGFNGFMTMGLGLLVLQPELESDTVVGLLAAGLDLGVGVGMYTGRSLTWSSSRLTYVSLGEFLGGLTAGALAVVVADADTDERTPAAIVLAGAWGGFALAAHLTRDMATDARYRTAPISASVVPIVTDGGGRGIGLAGAF
ncbi:MAG: hypothetical protein KBG28_20495 [Kofleriaceae bacterium]|nr:hypothetical protein [Kofleriaceae bacterium]